MRKLKAELKKVRRSQLKVYKENKKNEVELLKKLSKKYLRPRLAKAVEEELSVIETIKVFVIK